MGVRTLFPVNKHAVARTEVVRPIFCKRDDEELLGALKEGQTWARAALFDRYGHMVERTLRRLLGPRAEGELADYVHDVFVQSLVSIDKLRDGAALSTWMQTIAARRAYRAIRYHRARRWLMFWEPERVPDVETKGIEPEIKEAYNRTFRVLEVMPAKERIVFALRHVQKLELSEIARVCGVSLATVKRRLVCARRRFQRLAERDDVLVHWVQEGGQWNG